MQDSSTNVVKITAFDPQENTVLVGFPSNGLVGTFSVSYIVNHLKMKQIDEIEISDIPSALFVEAGKILSPIRVYRKNNLFAVMSDVPFNQYLAEEFALEVHKFCKKKSIKKIVIVSGMDTANKQKNDPKIYGLVTHSTLERILYNNHIPKFLDGSIYGADASIISIFRKTNMPVVILYVECNPFFPDPEASIVAIITLAKVLNVKVDTQDIQNTVDKLRIQHRKLMEETMNAMQPPHKDQTGTPQIYR